MIDARDHVGVPVITTCPHYVRFEGVVYEVAADALVVRFGDITLDMPRLRDEILRWPYAAAPWPPTSPSGIFVTGTGA